MTLTYEFCGGHLVKEYPLTDEKQHDHYKPTGEIIWRLDGKRVPDSVARRLAAAWEAACMSSRN